MKAYYPPPHTHTHTHTHTGIQGIVVTKFIQDSCIYFWLPCRIWRPYLHFLSLSKQRTPVPYLSRHTCCCLLDQTVGWTIGVRFSERADISSVVLCAAPSCHLRSLLSSGHKSMEPYVHSPHNKHKRNKLQRRIIWNAGKTSNSVFRNLKFKTKPKTYFFFNIFSLWQYVVFTLVIAEYSRKLRLLEWKTVFRRVRKNVKSDF